MRSMHPRCPTLCRTSSLSTCTCTTCTSGKSFFRFIKMGWVALADLKGRIPAPRCCARLLQRLPDKRHYPFAVVPPNQEMSTPSQRVRLCRQAGLPTRWDDVADSEFFGYNHTASRTTKRRLRLLPILNPNPNLSLEPQHPPTLPMAAEAASASASRNGGG